MDPSSPAPWRPIHTALLNELDAMASSTHWIDTAATVGIESLMDALLRHVCKTLGTPPEVYVRALQQDASVRADLNARVSRLRAHPEMQRRRRELVHREAEQRLHVLRYLMSGVEPPAWVWEALGEDETQQVRTAAANGQTRTDPSVLPRVERALNKRAAGKGYGDCEDCGTSIPIERLQLVPWAECCTPCQRLREGSPPNEEPTGRGVPIMRF